MNRLVYGDNFFIKGFFRPLSDLTLCLSYLMGKFNPAYYRGFNFLLHALSAFVLFLFCRQSSFFTEKKDRYSFLAAILFLVYPYQSETVLWISGRASIVGSFFGFLSLYVLTTSIKSIYKMLLSWIFYFIGLLSYETILPLPLIALVLNIKRGRRFNLQLVAGYSISLILHIVFRRIISGTLTGAYGERVFDMSAYLERFLKGFGRLFLPPSYNSFYLIISFVLLFIGIVAVCITLYKKNKDAWLKFRDLFVCLLLSGMMAFTFGVSTRTYEGGRLFYFPAFFLCILIPYLISLVKNIWIRNIGVVLSFLYFFVFLQDNINNWEKAGVYTSAIVDKMEKTSKQSKIAYIINLPEEYNGAQIFRNGFIDALAIKQIHFDSVIIVNKVTTDDLLKNGHSFKAVFSSGRAMIMPYVSIKSDTITVINESDSIKMKAIDDAAILYWEGRELLEINK